MVKMLKVVIDFIASHNNKYVILAAYHRLS